MVKKTEEKNRFQFTKTRLESIPMPKVGRIVFYDTGCANLTLTVSPTSKVFYYAGRIKGRPTRLALGKFSTPDEKVNTMTVEQARKSCKRIAGAKADGRDPAAERQAIRREQTIGSLFTYWLETHAKRHKRTWAEDERQYKTFLKPWEHRKLSSIRKADIQTLHAKTGEKNGLYAANRLLALIRAMYNKSTDMGFTGSNPTIGIKKFPEEKRDRFLHGDELKKFFASLLHEPDSLFRDFFLVALLTGARRANVQAMQWQDIDFQAGIWRIPETKSGKPVVVPLVSPVVKVLQSRLDENHSSDWVFPSHGKTGHLTEPKSAWKRIITRAGLSDVRPHDLRRSLASWMAMGGSGLPVIGKMLGHTQASTTAIYARLQTDSVKDAAEKATSAMLSAGGMKLLEGTSNEG